ACCSCKPSSPRPDPYPQKQKRLASRRWLRRSSVPAAPFPAHRAAFSFGHTPQKPYANNIRSLRRHRSLCMRASILCALFCGCALIAGARAGDARKDARLTWAWQTAVRPTLPRVKDPGWIKNPIDAFVAAALEKEGLAPSPAADRLTLI